MRRYSSGILIRIYLLLIVIIFFSVNTSQAQDFKHHPFSGRLVFTAEAGVSIAKTDYMETINSHTFNGLGEYFFQTKNHNIFGLRLTAGLANLKGKDNRRIPDSFSTTTDYIGLGPVYAYSIKDVLFPYAYAGISYNWFDPRTSNGKRTPNNQKNLYGRTSISYELETGIRIRINDDWSLLASAGIHFMQNDNLDDVSPEHPGNFFAGPHYDFYATGLIGVSFSLFGVKDSDGDGVNDDKDLCPNTPKGILIDENGCPLDSDGDGVPDYLDQCFGTPRGAKVDKNGCPLDSDGDGVPDYQDKCSNTPTGVKVDKNGCPLDSDGDGVPDFLDKCPETNPGLKVDNKGCPIDSDQDGVPDSLDKCPDTPLGMPVDENGCEVKKEQPKKKEAAPKETPKQQAPKEETPIKPNTNIQPEQPENENVSNIPANTSRVVISEDETFQPNSSEIKQSAYPNLDNIVAFLENDPWTKWKISGYVDSQTPDDRKLPLSYERANAILKYFIAKGLPSFQFQIYGLGDESPVASNSTPDGRAKNRRIELTKIKK